MKKRTSFALICVLLFSLLLTTSCNLFQPQDQSSTPRDSSSNATTPPITATSYEDVISIYRMAVKHLGTYCNLYPQEFANDMYAEEIINANDKAKEVYQNIFMAAFELFMDEFGVKYQGNGINAYGYTLFDINGNGTDELILMSDECDIVSIFAMIDDKATPVFHNLKGKRYFITADGSIKNRYQGDRSTDYVYFEHTYTWKSDDTLFDAGENKAPINEHIGRKELLEITKQNISSMFVRLMGPLTLQKSEIMTWEWSNNTYRDRYGVRTDIWGKFTHSNVRLSVSISGVDEIRDISAKREGDFVYFEDEKASGRIEFNAQSVWVIIDNSKDGNFSTGAWLLEYISYSKG